MLLKCLYLLIFTPIFKVTHNCTTVGTGVGQPR